ncbi:MAG: phosphoserine transaminase [Rhodospirillaceae bacterium]
MLATKVDERPKLRPKNPCFSSGPCAKRPGWTVNALSAAVVGRSHRSEPGKERLNEVIVRSREILGIPEDYLIGIVPASDTGAVEMALWSLLGPREVDVLAWESFGSGWVNDILKQLKIPNANIYEAEYGELPMLDQVDWDHDVVFTWNGTTSGVCVPNGDWIDGDREGLSICDATSAVFAMPIVWDKLDVITWSWQKVMGGEGQHGMLVLSPRAIQRLESYSPPWPVPKIFRLTSSGKLIQGIFKGETINTPSMICVEDALDGLRWGQMIGGLEGLIGRSRSNLDVIAKWVGQTNWIDFLAKDPAIRSNTSVCLSIIDPWFLDLEPAEKALVPKEIERILGNEKVAFDINGYRDAPPGLRIWAGATVESSDLEALFPWLDWAYSQVKDEV